MDPVERFKKERDASLLDFRNDAGFQNLSQDWLRESMQRRYVYNFDWMGRPIIQYPQDMVALQEIVWDTKPDVILETGIAHGGSLILSASLLAMLDYADAVERGELLDPAKPKRRVVGIDIDIRAHNRGAMESHPMASRITMIEGSSTAQETIDRAKEAVGDAKRVMVCLDSMHTHDHVVAELDAYATLVTPGCYCLVLDSFVEDMPQGFFKDRPWDVGNNPKTALHSWLQDHPDFTIDRDMATKLQVTVAPDGFLRRT